MSEKTYPRAWGVFICDGLLNYNAWDAVSDDPEEAEEWAEEFGGAEVVELIPRPEHDLLIAEAVAAERERCMEIARMEAAEAASRGNEMCESKYDYGAWDAACRIHNKIRGDQ